MHLAALMRDANGLAAAAPLTLVVKRPDGVESLARRPWRIRASADATLDLVLPADAASGGWTVQAFADPKSPAIGETGFLVEDYVPERMDMVLTPEGAPPRVRAKRPRSASPCVIFTARRAPIWWSTATSRSRPRPTTACPRSNGYEAGVADEDFSTVKNELDDTPTTDAKGAAVVDVAIPQVKATRPLQAKIALRAGEEGGRAIERIAYLPLLPQGGLIGVKKNFSSLCRRRAGEFRRHRHRPGRPADDAAQRPLVALPHQQRLPMVQAGRPLEFRAGEIVAPQSPTARSI